MHVDTSPKPRYNRLGDRGTIGAPKIYKNIFPVLMFLYLSLFTIGVYGEETWEDFFTSRPDKGLIYLKNISGLASDINHPEYHNVIRIMFNGQNYDKDERYPVTNYDIPEKVYIRDIRGNSEYLGVVGENPGSKRLGLRGCCANVDNRQLEKRQIVHTFPDEPHPDHYQTRETKLYNNEGYLGLANYRYGAIIPHSKRDIEMGEWIPTNPDPNWWTEAAKGIVGVGIGTILSNFATEVINNMRKNKNCFDEVATWIEGDYSVSFEIRGGGNCGTTAIRQTIYDGLYQVVDQWRKDKVTRACAVFDHEGGGRIEFAMSATAQPAYAVDCKGQKFYACKGNENGEPTCQVVKNIHDEI